MAGFEKFKTALKNVETQKYEELQKDVKNVKNVIEKILKMALENTAQVTRSSYAGLEMLWFKNFFFKFILAWFNLSQNTA